MADLKEKLQTVLDKALEAGKPFEALHHSPQITPEVVAQTMPDLGAEMFTKVELKSLAEDQRVLKAARERINLCTQEHARAAYVNQRNAWARAIADGKPLPDVQDWFTREEFMTDLEEQKGSVYEGFRIRDEERVLPLIKKGFKVLETACEQKLAELEKAERKAAARVGLVWSPTTEYLTIRGVRDFARRMQNQKPGGGALPSERLQGLVNLD